MKKIKIDHLECVAIRISYQTSCKICSKPFVHQEICYRIPIHDPFIACVNCSQSFNMKEPRMYWEEGSVKR
ncbi:hypothetical protein J2S74_004099 [Evansella vedderi]|uniref:Uncharacterized protein n=1 Tax=Evansella vedderi TaxID=38282 RepID=A0ABU0A0Y6_9BACI|nr:hypothetical protein [Evansella vedderi]